MITKQLINTTNKEFYNNIVYFLLYCIYYFLMPDGQSQLNNRSAYIVKLNRLTFFCFPYQLYLMELLFTKNKGPGKQRVNKKPFMIHFLAKRQLKNGLETTF